MRAALLCLAIVGCSSTDASEREPLCSDMRAFRVGSETCLVEVRTSLRSCTPGGDEQHWGFGVKCVWSPAGELHVVIEPFGATVTGNEGWVDVDADAGSAVETCSVALQALHECGW